MSRDLYGYRLSKSSPNRELVYRKGLAYKERLDAIFNNPDDLLSTTPNRLQNTVRNSAKLVAAQLALSGRFVSREGFAEKFQRVFPADYDDFIYAHLSPDPLLGYTIETSVDEPTLAVKAAIDAFSTVRFYALEGKEPTEIVWRVAMSKAGHLAPDDPLYMNLSGFDIEII